MTTQITKLSPKQTTWPPAQQKGSVTQNTIPAERVSSLAANQVCGPCFIQGHFLLWFLDSGGADVCTPLSLESFRFSDSADAQHPQNKTVSSWQKGHKSGFSENPIFLHLAGFCLQPLIQFHTVSEWLHSRSVTQSTAQFYSFFHQRNISWFEEASWPQQRSLLPKTSWKSGSRFHVRTMQMDWSA